MGQVISIPSTSPCELINIESINPLISKCQIKVCYVGDEPNRNHSIITKAVATEMAKSLPGSPIVGFYNQTNGDFEEHNRTIDISDGKFEIKDRTKPYGFVDVNAKVWFQKFMDDGVEHEYLMTEGYIWSEIYPESKRVIEKGNNQSMELSEKFLQGNWTIDDNGMPQFFIINEAIIEKLCILGEKIEPCFEGAGIAAQFSLDSEFKNNLFAMIKEIQTVLKEGGIRHMDEEEKKIPAPVEEFKKTPEEEKKDEEKTPSEDSAKDEKKPTPPAAEEDKKDEGEKKKAKKYTLEEIPEYVELNSKFSALEAQVKSLTSELEPLRKFKAEAELKEKKAMIDSFYMLSDTEKKEVVDNINTYSLSDIEAKLSIICVRNKVNFNLEDDKKTPVQADPLVYSLGENDDNSDNAPAWIKAVRDTAKSMN